LLSNTDKGGNQYGEPFSFVCDRVRKRGRIQPCGLGQAIAGFQVKMMMSSVTAMAATPSALGEPLECSKARHQQHEEKHNHAAIYYRFYYYVELFATPLFHGV
jgi:hypothetical protein